MGDKTDIGANNIIVPQTFESLIFYRGLSHGRPLISPIVLKPRKDRKPRDMPIEIHNKADTWFEQRFGIRYRSQAVFVTGSHFIAQNYAASPEHVVRVIPLGPYKYCWSPKNSDLLFFCSKLQSISVEEYLASSNYTESDLNAACESGHEVMLYCDSYIAIPISLLDSQVDRIKSPVILT